MQNNQSTEKKNIRFIDGHPYQINSDFLTIELDFVAFMHHKTNEMIYEFFIMKSMKDNLTRKQLMLKRKRKKKEENIPAIAKARC